MYPTCYSTLSAGLCRKTHIRPPKRGQHLFQKRDQRPWAARKWGGPRRSRAQHGAKGSAAGSAAPVLSEGRRGRSHNGRPNNFFMSCVQYRSCSALARRASCPQALPAALTSGWFFFDNPLRSGWVRLMAVNKCGVLQARGGSSNSNGLSASRRTPKWPASCLFVAVHPPTITALHTAS